MKRFENKSLLIIAIALWLGAVTIGLAILLDYENSPGPDGASLSQWPKSTSLSLDRERPLLIMFAHPQCPCTRASMNELARLVAQCQGRMVVRVLFYQPESENEKWMKSELWESAVSIPGVEVQADEDGREAKLFKASTSGYCALYSPEGELLYSGGINGLPRARRR